MDNLLGNEEKEFQSTRESGRAIEDWEVVDDDGFIYKRRKKQKCTSAGEAGLEDNKTLPEGEDRQQIDARREEITKLEAQKIRYKAEIEVWERLLGGQNAEMKTKETPVQEIEEPLHNEVEDDLDVCLGALDSQVEAYEDMIGRLKNLRDRGEIMCKMLQAAFDKAESAECRAIVEELNVLQKTPRSLIGNLTSAQSPKFRVKALNVSTDIGRLLAGSPA